MKKSDSRINASPCLTILCSPFSYTHTLTKMNFPEAFLLYLKDEKMNIQLKLKGYSMLS
ncbi:hypothetical protein [Aquimarina pacifica]|uniref:hypothetical protein n=1 Tax=Aquimarina pacifica TaxID=1296415 RepID=UPI00137738EB|nr:hypothetical protein [Aquimarina pacifica]